MEGKQKYIGILQFSDPFIVLETRGEKNIIQIRGLLAGRLHILIPQYMQEFMY